MLYLGYILLRYVLLYILEVSFNFHFNFRAPNVIGSKHSLGVGDACDTVFFLSKHQRLKFLPYLGPWLMHFKIALG